MEQVECLLGAGFCVAHVACEQEHLGTVEQRSAVEVEGVGLLDEENRLPRARLGCLEVAVPCLNLRQRAQS